MAHIDTEGGPCKRWGAYYTFPNDANSCDVIGSWQRGNGRIGIAYMHMYAGKISLNVRRGPCWCSSVVRNRSMSDLAMQAREGCHGVTDILESGQIV